jgi:hypothetical protein
MLESGTDPVTLDELVAELSERWAVVPRSPARNGGPRTVDVVVRS